MKTKHKQNQIKSNQIIKKNNSYLFIYLCNGTYRKHQRYQDHEHHIANTMVCHLEQHPVARLLGQLIFAQMTTKNNNLFKLVTIVRPITNILKMKTNQQFYLIKIKYCCINIYGLYWFV